MSRLRRFFVHQLVPYVLIALLAALLFIVVVSSSEWAPVEPDGHSRRRLTRRPKPSSPASTVAQAAGWSSRFPPLGDEGITVESALSHS